MINNKLLETLYNLDNTFGVSGNEEETAAALRKEMEGLYDEHIEDPLGSQIFIKYGKDCLSLHSIKRNDKYHPL